MQSTGLPPARRAATLCLLLAAAAGAAEEGAPPAAGPPPERPALQLLGGSIGLGAGSGHSMLGFQLQARVGDFAAFVSLPTWGTAPWSWSGGCRENSSPSTAWGAGLRWYRAGDRGLYVGGNLLFYHFCYGDGPFSSSADGTSITYYSLLAGWRFRFGPLYLDLAAGPAAAHVRNECTYCQQRLLSSETSFGVPVPVTWGVQEDLSLPWGNFEIGVGLAF